MGSNHWMDMIFFTLIFCKNCIVSLKRRKINEKEAGVGPVFFKKNVDYWFGLIELQVNRKLCVVLNVTPGKSLTST